MTGSRVLVTGAGGPAGVAVVRHLVSLGMFTVAVDSDPLAAGLFLADEHALVALACDPDDLVATLAETVKRFEVDVVVCTVAEEMLALVGARARDRRCRVVAGSRRRRSLSRQGALLDRDECCRCVRAALRDGERSSARRGVGPGPVDREAPVRARFARRVCRRRPRASSGGRAGGWPTRSSRPGSRDESSPSTSSPIAAASSSAPYPVGGSRRKPGSAPREPPSWTGRWSTSRNAPWVQPACAVRRTSKASSPTPARTR